MSLFVVHEHEQQRATLRFKCKSAILTLEIENLQNCIVDSLFWSELSRTVLSGRSAHGIQNIIFHIFYPRMKNTFAILSFFTLKISPNIFDVISLHTILFSIFDKYFTICKMYIEEYRSVWLFSPFQRPS